MSHVVDGLPAWSISSHIRIILKKGWLLVRGCSYHFCPEEKYGSKVFPRNGQFFGQCALKHQSRWFQSVMISELVFLVIENVWQVWSCSKSWCIPNYQLSVSFKNSSFLLPDFEEFEKKFLNREFYGQMPEQAWSNGLFDLFKIVPLGAPRFSKYFKMEESVY